MAVNVSNIEVTEFSGYLADSCTLSKETSSDSFSYGDLVSNDAYDGAVDVVGEADKSQFIGVSLVTVDGTTDTVSKINVAIKCVIRCLEVNEIFFGEAAAYSTGANGTEWSFTNTVAQAIAHCRSEVISATSYGLFLIDPYTARAVTTLGFFEVPA